MNETKTPRTLQDRLRQQHKDGWRGDSIDLKTEAADHIDALAAELAAMRAALVNILARIDDDEFIPTEYVQDARALLKQG